MKPILDDDVRRDVKLNSPVKETRKSWSREKKKTCNVCCRAWPKSIAKIIEKCWEDDPSYRPSFSQIQHKWQKIVNSPTDPLEDAIVEAGPWFPADVKSSEFFQFEGIIVREDENEDKKTKKNELSSSQSSSSSLSFRSRPTTWSSRTWSKLIFELLRSNHIRISRQNENDGEIHKITTISLQRCRIAEQLRHSLQPKSMFTLGVEILGPNTRDRASKCVVLRSTSKDRLYRFQQRLMYRQQRRVNMLGMCSDFIGVSPRNKSHPEISKKNVNDLFKGQCHASFFAQRGDVKHLHDLFEKFECSRIDNEDSSTALHEAAESGRNESLNYLISEKISLFGNIDCKDDSNRTPLFYACDRGHARTVKLLLKNGANPNVRDVNGITPLILACVNGWKDCVFAMMEVSRSCDAPLIVAASFGHVSIVKFMISKKCCSDQIVRTEKKVR